MAKGGLDLRKVIAMTKTLGFGTGCLYKNLEPVSTEAIKMIRSSGCNAIELCAIRVERLKQLDNIGVKDLSGFSHVSLHAPDTIYKDDTKTHDILERIQRKHRQLRFKVVVLCPDFIEDWHVFDKYDIPIAFENTDLRTHFGNSINDMREVLKNPKFNMVLDLTHVYTVDKDMDLARKFSTNFASRIAEIHLSGYYIHGSDEQQHYPIHISKQKEILKSVLLDVPIIIESVWPKITNDGDPNSYLVKEIKKEYEYVYQNLD